MFTTISESQFVNTFDEFDRSENFSREGRRALFDYFEQQEEETGTPIEFDCIAICCEYNEMEVDDIIYNYGVDVEQDADDEERAEVVREYLEENTQVVAELSNGASRRFVFAAF